MEDRGAGRVMQSELQCPVCSGQYRDPVLLPCKHTVCRQCVSRLITNRDIIREQIRDNSRDTIEDVTRSTVRDIVKDALFPGSDNEEHSEHSETDSGVDCQGPQSLNTDTVTLQLTCVTCQVSCHVTARHGCVAECLAECRLMRRIVDKCGAVSSQLCELCDGAPRYASVQCQQCQVAYCCECQRSLHPARGPLAQHCLLPLTPTLQHATDTQVKCWRHGDLECDLYCVTCDQVTCTKCRADQGHQGHELQVLTTAAKQMKTRLSDTLRRLSAETMSVTQRVQQLPASPQQQAIYQDLEKDIMQQCHALEEQIRSRCQQLIGYVRAECQRRSLIGQECVTSWTNQIRGISSLVQFTIEALKESDPSAFMQIGASLENRASSAIQNVQQHQESLRHQQDEVDSLGCCGDLRLDVTALGKTVKNQLKLNYKNVPGTPRIVADQCCSASNSVVIVWQLATSTSCADLIEDVVFQLELDDGDNGDFSEVYRGTKTTCTVDGLHYNAIYRARVRALNSRGSGDYSDVIMLQTAPVAKFRFDPAACSNQLVFSSDNTCVEADSFEPLVVMTTTAFSRGRHYWQLSLENYDGFGDPAFGVARSNVQKSLMLGMDEAGWSMYVDGRRSWHVHAGCHSNRQNGGVHRHSVIGVLVDMNRGLMHFTIDDTSRGGALLSGISGTISPAVSVSRKCRVKLHTGITPPDWLVQHLLDADWPKRPLSPAHSADDNQSQNVNQMTRSYECNLDQSERRFHSRPRPISDIIQQNYSETSV